MNDSYVKILGKRFFLFDILLHLMQSHLETSNFPEIIDSMLIIDLSLCNSPCIKAYQKMF